MKVGIAAALSSLIDIPVVLKRARGRRHRTEQ
jgi:hypothetical protein